MKPSLFSAPFQAEWLHLSGFIQEGDMVRLNAIQRAQSIPESITPYCTDTDQLDMAARYRIIVSTCSTAGQLYSLGLRGGHITHVFVDEVCDKLRYVNYPTPLRGLQIRRETSTNITRYLYSTTPVKRYLFSTKLALKGSIFFLTNDKR